MVRSKSSVRGFSGYAFGGKEKRLIQVASRNRVMCTQKPGKDKPDLERNGNWRVFIVLCSGAPP